ncbi:MAG: hypothetical protein AAFR59_14470, partial [Bacteroidota bacterium]
MKRYILTVMLLGMSTWAWAQGALQRQVFSSTGGEAQVGTLTVSQTFGEPIVSLGTVNGSLTVFQGYQQSLSLPAASTNLVWPGDANSDFVANNIDLLPIGLYFGSTGPARQNASNNWLPQTADLWTGDQNSGANLNHIDCNGDGIINAADTVAIQLNYGLTHNRPQQATANGIPLSVHILNDRITGGDTVYFDVNIGADTMVVVEGYGFAFGLEIDTSLFEHSSLSVQFDSSWLGVEGQDLLTLTRPLTGNTALDVAVTRFDQVSRTGFGRIMTCSIIVIDDLAGKHRTTEYLTITPVAQQAYSAQGTFIPLSPQSNQVEVDEVDTHLEKAMFSTAKLRPQPARDRLWIRNVVFHHAEITLYDLEGRLLKHFSMRSSDQPLIISGLPEAMFLIQIQT